MASVGVRRQDTTRGPPLRVLSLDGGGVRGYSMLILLQELMHRTYVEIHGRAPRRNETPKPCDHFDLIGGTGTGGLIAIMLGRLRLDLETCKDVYVRMTRRVFETDKTIAGIPFRSTLFKASKLEEAIRDCVREHTIFDDEGNDTLGSAQDMRPPVSPDTPASALSRSMSSSSRPMSISPAVQKSAAAAGRWGNANALLYDTRENRTKTAITAVYKGSPKNAPAALLRSYDSRREPAPESQCSIWQAGRATSATGLAFKPIQIGQSVFIDEGNGKFNPGPQILDEAAVNEYPGREVGVFVSIGTGKRPGGTDSQKEQWWESFCGGSVGGFAEAKRKLLAKIEGCEDTHQYMLREHLTKRAVLADNYYRLNVEVGVGEFGMNEWNRLSDISTNTRMYLSRSAVQAMNHSASSKMARIHKAKERYERAASSSIDYGNRASWQESVYSNGNIYDPSSTSTQSYAPPPNPLSAELPADEGFSETRPNSQLDHTSSPPTSPGGTKKPHGQAQAQDQHYKPAFPYQRVSSLGDKFAVIEEPSLSQHPALQQQHQQQQASSDEYPQPVNLQTLDKPLPVLPLRTSEERRRTQQQQQAQYMTLPPSQNQYDVSPRVSAEIPPQARSDVSAVSSAPYPHSNSTSAPAPAPQGAQTGNGTGVPPPPIPPKTPLRYRSSSSSPPHSASGSDSYSHPNPNMTAQPTLSHPHQQQQRPHPTANPHNNGSSGQGQEQSHGPRAQTQTQLPYPDYDGPPPPVNFARKPEYVGRF